MTVFYVQFLTQTLMYLILFGGFLFVWSYFFNTDFFFTMYVLNVYNNIFHLEQFNELKKNFNQEKLYFIHTAKKVFRKL